MADKTPEQHFEEGLAHLNAERFDDAIASFTQAIEKLQEGDPNCATAYSNRGNAYHEKGDHAQAIKDYDEAIRLNPNYADAYSNRGNAYHAMGNYARAIENYNKAKRGP